MFNRFVSRNPALAGDTVEEENDIDNYLEIDTHNRKARLYFECIYILCKVLIKYLYLYPRLAQNLLYQTADLGFVDFLFPLPLECWLCRHILPCLTKTRDFLKYI